MAYTPNFAENEPSRTEIDALSGPALIEFGAPWCGHCQAAQPLIAEALSGVSAVQHLKIEDGPGRPLGRSYKVKLWPTLVFIKQGQEVARLTRPDDLDELRSLLNMLAR